MGEILGAFGIDARLIVVQIFNFALLAVALWYFLYKPVLRMIDERKERAEQGVRDAEEAARARTEIEREKEVVLSLAHQRAEGIIDEAAVHAKEKSASIVADAEVRGERILKNAQSVSDELRRQAQKDAEADIAKMAVLAAEKVLAGKR